jgi:putative (di)nucleoside polyphosphate hydrolase
LSAKEIENLPYRSGIGLMIVNKKLEVFVGRRIDSKLDAWQMPQGGIDENEEPADAVRREMLEETGIKNARIITETNNWYQYNLPGHLINRLWDGKFRGQKQKWFLIEFLGEDKEIKIDNEIPEFIEWKWIKIEELSNIIIPFKRALYISVIEEFRDHILELRKKNNAQSC